MRKSALWIAYAVVLASPLVAAHHPPLQDWPLHLATTRILHDYHSPAYGFDADFALRLGSTQYVLYHLAASALAYVLGVAGANVALLASYLGGSVLAMRALLGVLGKDQRLALVVAPLLVNVMFLYGLLPFLVAIPTMLAATAVALAHFARPRWATGVCAAFLGVALFYLHVLPLLLFAIAYAACFPWRNRRAWIATGAPAAPVAALVAWWAWFTPEGAIARVALFRPDRPSSLGPMGKLADAFNWLGDVWRDLSDEVLWGATAALVVAALALGWRDRRGETRTLAAYAAVPAACAILFFFTGDRHGHIWMIGQRMPVLFVLTVVPLLRFPDGASGRALSLSLVAVGLASTVCTAAHFRRFDATDAAGFDDAIALMRPRARVAGLVFDGESSVAQLHPLLHFASYYQAEKGGVVEFTFAGYPHWPLTFKDGRAPPSGSPARQGWEWTPQLVPASELWPYFDYVITRGEGFRPPPERFVQRWSGGRWRLWERAARPVVSTGVP